MQAVRWGGEEIASGETLKLHTALSGLPTPIPGYEAEQAEDLVWHLSSQLIS